MECYRLLRGQAAAQIADLRTALITHADRRSCFVDPQVLPAVDLSLQAPVRFDLELPHEYPLVPPVVVTHASPETQQCAQISGETVSLALLRPDGSFWRHTCEYSSLMCEVHLYAEPQL